MGLLDNFVKSSIDGVVIELDKGNTPYVAGEKVMIFMNQPLLLNFRFISF